MSNSEVLVKVEDVSKKFCRNLKRSLWYGVKDLTAELFCLNNHRNLRENEFWSVKDVSFELRRGEVLGIIGQNGVGKTTLLKMINGLIKPDRGKITIKGRVGALIALGAGFNPILTGRENIYINAAVLGLSKREVDKVLDDIIDFADIGDFIDSPVSYYSSGMHVRLGFAVAAYCEPDILLVDEVLAVGDAAFQAKCFQRMSKLIEGNCTVILVSHHMYHIARICNTVLFLNHGTAIEYGKPSKAIQSYRSYAGTLKDIETEHLKAPTKLEKVRLVSISIRNGQGAETDKFHAGEKCLIEVSYSTAEPIKNPVITLSFTATFDQLQTHYSTKGNLDDFLLNGDGIIALDILYLGLASGKWRISVGIFDQDYIHPLAWEWFIKEIDICERDDDIMHGRFRMPHNWKIQ